MDNMEKKLTHKSYSVRRQAAKEIFSPTAEQIERGIRDESCQVRRVWAQCKNYIPTDGQISYGLGDNDIVTQSHWIDRAVSRLNELSDYECRYADNSWDRVSFSCGLYELVRTPDDAWDVYIDYNDGSDDSMARLVSGLVSMEDAVIFAENSDQHELVHNNNS